MDNAAWWASLALVAVFSALGGFAVGRSRRRSVAPASAPALAVEPALLQLVAGAVPLDLLPLPPGGVGSDPAASLADSASGEPLARLILKSFGPEGLLCELLDAMPTAVVLGLPVACFFAPQQLNGAKVNFFASVIAAVDAVAEPPRLMLGRPEVFLSVPRRRHPRKRVNDQGFVRVRLWLAQAGASPVFFPDAAPDIWINAYDGHQAEENAVTDISAGGLSLEVRSGLVPSGLAVGSAVVLKCSLFQFKEKQFRPYWYAGVVRALSAPDDPDDASRLRRISVGFTHVGVLAPASAQGITWTERPQSETQGERR